LSTYGIPRCRCLRRDAELSSKKAPSESFSSPKYSTYDFSFSTKKRRQSEAEEGVAVFPTGRHKNPPLQSRAVCTLATYKSKNAQCENLWCVVVVVGRRLLVVEVESPTIAPSS